MDSVGVDSASPPPEENNSQADFIKQELNFDIDPNDPLTQASLNDHPVNEWMDILGNGQLRKKVVKPGKDNTRPNRLDLCMLSFTVKLEDGTIVDEAEDLIVQVGDVEYTQGLDLALALMETEEEAIIEAEARFGYGSLGRPAVGPFPEIPSNAKLIYNVTLKRVGIEPDIDTLPISKKREIGNKKKERGNWWFSRKEYTLATQSYRRALDYLSLSSESAPENEKSERIEHVSDADLQAILEDSLVVHNNLAAAQMQCEAYDAALKSVENVLRCQPLNVKALFRKGKILHVKLEHAKAVAVLLQALKIEPDNKAVQKELEVLKKKSAKDAQHEKNLYRKMLGTTNNKNKSELNVKETKKVSTKVTWSLLGGTIAAVVGIVAYKFIS
ncbi:peptidyl-prolyl cis-trans isomerase FKBP8 [Copidosoma floridanum]|uniref:peptidyl-prolyl cis-trans isomerase FKBP8 n=1 Tax=Copidosoma floridanum TaxID=29053 RepID=UPI0006C99E9F|nr:peptidyl-prolyl cis-trans isomerase FKBP8 [Copidosoma floridanum]XP_014207006.1 peptidyl-prolyl cis-trans isomerase FKBP8 [Copidosoma floridanum]XP_014207013.1 peptidyl-prolyl cis-trans isomerase FKBP8 [Copidosoma floridanum]XP_014207022.1 peptidyl-prolyl cis-trans isomerase FKBP8 [Copidosoma floridanum]